ncbi:uncharacterized protein LOC106086177, partial [Stomoxys calcitrans]|uniref:uncharacterized protein LOC106086177 n=1 Tax=Stomoxys calcitrans TaxID=35570 RepID=UPI0027E2593E
FVAIYSVFFVSLFFCLLSVTTLIRVQNICEEHVNTFRDPGVYPCWVVWRFFVFAFAAIAAASAASISSEYLTPVEDNSLLTKEYIPPDFSAEPAPLSDDGYRYKVVRKLRLRNRRDVSELPTGEYLPPAQAAPSAEEAVVVEAPAATEDSVMVEAPLVAASQDSAVLASDGYRYKTVRRIRYRRRRDVSELVNNQYLPPVAATQQEEVAVEAVPEQTVVVEGVAPVEFASQDSTVLANDGYRYKTVRRIRYRHRRDVNELVNNEYLPPAAATQQEEVVVEAAPEQTAVVEEVAPVEIAAQDSAVLASDGYRYKTVRRIRYRRRRDVNELLNIEYLPPVATSQQQDVVAEAAPEQTAVVEEVESVAPAQVASHESESAVLADDGYRYKTVRRIRYRRRRDVNELVNNEYLPPVAASQQQEVVVEAVPEQNNVIEEVANVEVPAEAASQESFVLAADGYRYKTVRRIRYRHRRDVNELVNNEYLPPAAATQQEEVVVEAAPEQTVVVEEAAPVEAASQESSALASDGYRYKTVRRIRYRHRRDVNELVNNEYLPPAAATQQQEVVVDASPEQASFVVETVPEQDVLVSEAPIQVASQDSAVLANDGYRYKTVRRIRYRHRRDVNELVNNEYLPPVAASQQQEVTVEAVPEQTTVVEEADPEQYAVAVEAPVEALASQDSAVLASDGYRYKTVRRIRYRHRRDVSELVNNDYLPPVAATQQEEVFVEAAPEQTVVVEEAAPIEAASQDSAVLANDGYRYKTLRRIRYRYRRDVSELPLNKYLPPTEAQTQEFISVVPEPEETSVLADDGYRYKAVHRLKHRRH